MPIIAQISQAMHNVLMDLADSLAKPTGFVKRQVKVTGSQFASMLVFGWLSKPNATLEDLCQFGAAIGLTISPQALDQRFTEEAAGFLRRLLEALVENVISADPVAIAILQRFCGVFIEDSTIILLPDELKTEWVGFGGRVATSEAAVKLQVRWDMLHGTLDGPFLLNARTHDRIAAEQNHPLPPGCLRIADLGYWKLETLAAQDKQDIYWLTRLPIQVVFHDESGQAWSVPGFFAQQRGDWVEMEVRVGAKHRLRARLLAIRVPLEVGEERRRRLKEQARSKGQKVSQARLSVVDWTFFITNVPAEQLSLEEALVLARVRWQMELLFRLWKAHGKVDEWRSIKPWRILCELYAKLIGLVMQHWVFLAGSWYRHDRSFPKAARAIQAHAMSLLLAMRDRSRLAEAIGAACASLQVGCRTNRSVKRPRTWQLLMALGEAAVS
jgi:hypothetical protein